MSEITIATLITEFLKALPLILAQGVLFYQNWRNSRKIDANTTVTQATEAKTDALVTKTVITEQKVDAVGGALAEVSKKTDDQTAKIDAVNTKAEVIAGHVNSEKTAGQGREATLAAENKLLREMMIVLERSAASIAQSRPTIQVLEQIDKHAEQIENNTAKIETKVEALRNGS